MTGRLYSLIFFAMLFAIPGCIIASTESKRMMVECGASMIFNLWFIVCCSRRGAVILDGFGEIATKLMSGCMNLTVLYIFPVLLGYYLVLIVKVLALSRLKRTKMQQIAQESISTWSPEFWPTSTYR